MLGLRRGGMPAVGKHFPGHGYIQADSHLEKSIDQRCYADIEMCDLIPFKRMIHYGLHGIMPAHVIYSQIDPFPAGFSKFWLQQILRTELQFEGCIFSDDLSMRGAGEFLESMLARAQAALAAGCDMILVCNNSAGADEILNGLQWEMPATSLSRLARMHALANDYLDCNLRLVRLRGLMDVLVQVFRNLVVLSALVMVVAIPIFGRLSDRLGRPKTYAIGSALLAIVAYPAFWLMATGNPLLIFASMIVAFGVIYAICYGPEAALFADLFDPRVRYSGISFVYQFSGIFASGITPIIATYLLEANGKQPWYLVGYVVFAALVSMVSALAIGARNGRAG